MPRQAVDCSLIIPTHNRRQVLDETLARLESLSLDRCEIIVVDNGSTDGTSSLQQRYAGVRWIEPGRNLGAAARNLAAVAARGRLLLMLDDDSWPAEGAVQRLVSLFDVRPELGAAACRVRLAEPPRRHDAGGVPGIFFNCGGAVRRDAFLQAGGFPIDFDYYVEEYDLCCRLLARGWRIEPRGDCLVWHRRVMTNRDNNRMLRLLVRNNLRLWSRYAPAGVLNEMLDGTVERYRRVAEGENALRGFEEGVAEGRAELAAGPVRRGPLSMRQFEDLFGLSACRLALREWADNHKVQNAAVWSRGKGCEQLLSTMASLRIRVHAVYDRDASGKFWRGVALRSERQFDPDEVDGIVAGTLSPGVADDLCGELRARFAALPVVSPAPWVQHEPESLAIPA